MGHPHDLDVQTEILRAEAKSLMKIADELNSIAKSLDRTLGWVGSQRKGPLARPDALKAIKDNFTARAFEARYRADLLRLFADSLKKCADNHDRCENEVF